MAALRRHRSTKKYTTKPRSVIFNAGLCKGLFGYFSQCFLLRNAYKKKNNKITENSGTLFVQSVI